MLDTITEIKSTAVEDIVSESGKRVFPHPESDDEVTAVFFMRYRHGKGRWLYIIEDTDYITESIRLSVTGMQLISVSEYCREMSLNQSIEYSLMFGSDVAFAIRYIIPENTRDRIYAVNSILVRLIGTESPVTGRESSWFPEGTFHVITSVSGEEKISFCYMKRDLPMTIPSFIRRLSCEMTPKEKEEITSNLVNASEDYANLCGEGNKKKYDYVEAVRCYANELKNIISRKASLTGKHRLWSEFLKRLNILSEEDE